MLVNGLLPIINILRELRGLAAFLIESFQAVFEFLVRFGAGVAAYLVHIIVQERGLVISVNARVWGGYIYFCRVLFGAWAPFGLPEYGRSLQGGS